MTNLNTQANIDAIFAAMEASDYVVLDDHQEGKPFQLAGIGVHVRNGEQQAVAIMHGPQYYSVNEVYLDKGVPRLSRMSVGGTIMYNVSVKAAIDEYNRVQNNGVFKVPNEINCFKLREQPVTKAS